MTVGNLSRTCWIFFIVMSVAFLPLAHGIYSIHGPSAPVRLVLVILVVGALWWGPFAYAMYLSLAVIRNGDRRLLKRGISGTAVVLSAKRTNTVVQEGEFAWEAPRVYKYRLKVTVPGKSPYETTCSICAAGIRAGETVNVAVSRPNRKRVTIDVGQGSKDGSGAGVRRQRPGGAAAAAGAAPNGSRDFSQYVSPVRPASPTLSSAERLDELTKLGQLHSQGVLTDAEFAAQKAQILRE